MSHESLALKASSNGTKFEVPADFYAFDAGMEGPLVEWDVAESAPRAKSPLVSTTECGDAFASLPAMKLLNNIDSIKVSSRESKETYWSSDENFWNDWKGNEAVCRQKVLDEAKLKLEKSKQAAAMAAAAAEEDARLERERIRATKQEEVKRDKLLQDELNVSRTKSEKYGVSIHLAKPTVDSVSKFDLLMDKGKEQYRSQYITLWREISVGVSATAANARSIQINSNKLIAAISKAKGSADVVTWLSAFCGSRVVSQASTGNKILVWSFSYLVRTVAEKFPETIRIGVLGELTKIAPEVVHGLSSNEKALECVKHSSSELEPLTRFLVALLCVCHDENSLWHWVSCSIEALRHTKTFLHSSLAAIHLMRVYIWLDIGLFDFRRFFGTQAVMLYSLLEREVFPRVDLELQSIKSSTSASVQIKFYLEACYNILQSRKYSVPPDGQVLMATKESDLNPEL